MLKSRRLTRGVNSQGERFELVDDWTKPSLAHRDLGFYWMGRTVFIEGDGAGKSDMVDLNKADVKISKGCRLDGFDWAEMVTGGRDGFRWADA